MELTYIRKLSEAARTRAALFCLPRAVIQAWSANDFDRIKMVFDTEMNRIIITPVKSDNV